MAAPPPPSPPSRSPSSSPPHHRPPHPIPFGGTMSLSTEVYYRVLIDLLESLIAGGFRRFFLVNGHGGNDELVQLAARDLALKKHDAHLAAASYWNATWTALTDVGAHEQRWPPRPCRSLRDRPRPRPAPELVTSNPAPPRDDAPPSDPAPPHLPRRIPRPLADIEQHHRRPRPRHPERSGTTTSTPPPNPSPPPSSNSTPPQPPTIAARLNRQDAKDAENAKGNGLARRERGRRRDARRTMLRHIPYSLKLPPR
ncbi:MAG: creatininase family protein [Thermomicrobiales bacterium]